MTMITDRESLIMRMHEMIDAIPEPLHHHFSNLADDFSDATSDYMIMIPRFANALDSTPAIDFYADYDNQIAALELTDNDLAIIIYDSLANHDCDADACDID